MNLMNTYTKLMNIYMNFYETREYLYEADE